MNYLFLVLIFCFTIFLYVIYSLSRDDFVVLRSNASMEKIFNAAFLSAFFALFTSRLLYIVFNPKPIFLNPLGFLLFPYFPGLSLIGGLLGGFLFSTVILKSWNLPVGRIIDFFSMGFLVSFPFGFLGSFLLSQQKLSAPSYFSVILYLALLFIFIKFILPLSLGGKLKDGSLSLLSIFSFSLTYLISNIIIMPNFNLESILTVSAILFSLAFFVQKEKLAERYLNKK